MKGSIPFWIGAILVLVQSPASGQVPPMVPTIIVESPTMTTGEAIPRKHTPDGRNVSPPLVWGNLPEGTKQIAVVCEDHGAGNPPPWVHWVIYNIPGTATGLPEELPIHASVPMPAEIAGATQGNNGWGRAIYRGPAPPVGAVHHYNFIVYALDAELNLPAGLTRAALLERIEDHVIGWGEMVPFYQRPGVAAATP